MWKTVSNIKTIIGLSAISILIAYLLLDKINSAGIIKTSKKHTILLVFIVTFVFGVIGIALFSKASVSKNNETVIDGNRNKINQDIGNNNISKNNITSGHTLHL